MSNPIAADVKPVTVSLEAGKQIYWCACGRSKTQPFCDGSHRGTGISPLAFTPDESEEAKRPGAREIDIVISRTLVFGSLAAFIGVVYVAIVVGIGELIGASTDEPNAVLAIVAVGLAGTAWLAPPPREVAPVTVTIPLLASSMASQWLPWCL